MLVMRTNDLHIIFHVIKLLGFIFDEDLNKSDVFTANLFLEEL